MKIVVCIKHVPDVQSDRRMEDGFLVRGEEDVLNELDENAVEAAVSLVEELGGEVVTLTMGPEDAEDGLRRALQMGADSGVLVSDESLAGADVVATARTLAAAIARIGGVDPASPREEDQAATGDVDLVITGMASLDSMTSMLPGALAAALGVPALTLASVLEASDDGEVLVTRATGTLREVLAAPTPALVSVTDQANEPRYPNFAAMRAAKKKPVDTWDLAELGLEAGAGPAIAVVDSEARPAREAGIIRTDAGEAGRDLAAWLVDNKLV
ncbi:electron transfer flavoprotein subunit beta/FixA family protein [Actinomyces urogenitalis]|uniref:electron transfer flavoprotein subunit beta/FixA family protein n=1 Tax=Actinomyces urogenitalis TaxID=103621 RepID=UPI002901E9F4|nr:electron transfer flavoprotein subunit beta/FixA family protein [Actinomyces urogenitalis]MDU0864168.1 electron transfer flavoprotein subunit beta/FixA family protein [Actinomyces urogenitalis]MDU0874789.1 electron transfer flavoprotein subunit beta/FixA family protein [Actinomyces urogenitalis]MDU1564192.1 electron transfer flavoprotein subunit beta/FixA family protein [Actinomyces urogenitalis]MDU1639717.1 electron transfer flavoprotein subunit beta/FixA family protein [Actinomyces urogeni